MRGNPDLGIQRDLAVTDRLEGDVKRHHLGQRGRMQPGVGITRMQNLARARIHDHGRIGRRSHRQRAQDADPDCGEDNQPGTGRCDARNLHDTASVCLLPPIFRLAY